MTAPPPFGIRHDNPGNLRVSAQRWSGQDGSVDGFCRFNSPLWGLRALARTLIHYQVDHGLHTVRGIVDRWAPPNENQTSSYVADVSHRMRVLPDARIDVLDHATCCALVGAMVWHENGEQPYTAELIGSAVTLALMEEPASSAVGVHVASA